MDLGLRILQSLRAHALRYLLTGLGIAWGAFMLTYLSASLQGMDTHFVTRLQNIGPRIVFLWPGIEIKPRVGERGARLIELENPDLARLERLASVEQASPNLTFWSRIVRAGPRTKLLHVQGTSEAAREIRHFEVARGRFLSATDVERSRRVAFLGADAARRLFDRRDPLGRSLQIDGLGFRVVGVAARKGDQLVGVGGQDDRAILVPYTTAQRWLQKSDVLAHVVFAPETRERSAEAIWGVRQVLGLRHGFAPELEMTLTMVNIHAILQILHRLVFGLRIFLVGAGLATLLVGAIGVMNIMLVVVGERTREIGLRKAVGATDRAIFVEFLGEALTVSLMAGLLGAALGSGLAQITARLASEGSRLGSPPVFEPWMALGVTSALVAVGMIAGLVPAWRAARIPPAEALRAS